jgi:hypothetical protein
METESELEAFTIPGTGGKAEAMKIPYANTTAFLRTDIVALSYFRRPVSSCTLTSGMLLRNLDLDILRTLITAHDLGGFAQAADRLGRDDYSMGHILRFAREAGIGTLTIDLLTVRASRQVC